ncbi:MAG: Ig-like domain-containing protein [Candidatus Zixiibacteriota bacterium]
MTLRIYARFLAVFGLALGLLALNPGSARAQFDPGIPDTVQMADVQVNAGDHFGVPVRFFNDEPLAGGTLGFSWGTTDLNLDSISFVGSRLIADESRATQRTIDNINSRGLSGFFIFFEAPVPTGVGNWATFWFTASPTAIDQIIKLDSAFFPPSGDFILISDLQVSIEPQYVAGSVTIGNPQANTPPVLAPIGPQSIPEGQTLPLSISASDAESIPLLSVAGLPLNATFVDNNDGTGDFSFSPSFTQAGTHNVTFIASDPEFADSETVVITVSDVNRAPILNPIGDQSVDEGQSLAVSISAFDPDSDPLAFSITPPLPNNGTFTDNGNGSATISFAPDFTQSGATTHTVVVSDGNLPDNEIITITVNNVNRPPAITPVPPQAVTVGDSLIFSVVSSDPDGPGATLSAPVLPQGAVFLQGFDPAQGSVHWRPSPSQVGVHSATLVSSDGQLADTEVVTITVTDGNQAPVLDPIGNKQRPEGQTLNFTVTASDADADPLAFTIAPPLPVNGTFTDNGNNTATLNFAPDFTQAGGFTHTIVVSDGSLADSEVITISVSNVNQSPIISAIGPQTVLAGDSLVFDITSSDPDGTVPFLSAALLPQGAVFDQGINSSLGTFRWQPTVAQGGVHTATFVSTDGPSADTEVVTITVTVDNSPPVLAAIGPQSVIEGQTLNIPVSATDPDNDQLTLGAAPLPSGATFTDGADGSGVFTWTPDFTQSGTYHVTFTASDWALSDSETVTITVLETGSQSPVIAPIEPPVVNEGDTLFLRVSATDPDGTIPVLRSGPLPPNATFVDSGNGAGLLTFAPDFTQAGIVGVTFTASDGVFTDSAAVMITVIDVNRAPVISPIGPQTVIAGDSLVFEVISFDPDGTFPTLSAALLPPGAVFDQGINPTLGTFRWLPTVAHVGSHSAFFVASDGSLADSESVAITVTSPQPDTSRVGISDSLFVFESTEGIPFIGGDSLRIFHVGPGPELPWILYEKNCFMISILGDTTIFTPIIPWVSISPMRGVTPQYTFISVDNELLEAGTYICEFEADVDTTFIVDPQPFMIVLNVGLPQGQESILALSDSLFQYEVIEGDSIEIRDSITIFNSGPGPEFGWRVTDVMCLFSDQDCFDTTTVCFDTIVFADTVLEFFDPLSGITPSTLRFGFDTQSLLAGSYFCQFKVEADPGVLNSPRVVRAELRVDPKVEPSGDTLFVSTVPGTPGSKVKVPVTLINNNTIAVCSLTVPLKWASAQIFLDSVSFAGTRLEGMDRVEAFIDNARRTVTLHFAATSIALPAGDGRIAYLFFDIFSGITDAGVVPIGLDGPLFAHNCMAPFTPQFFPGGIVIDSSANVVCGRVVDTAGNEIRGARVQIWDNFPQGSVFAEDTTNFNGSFKFGQLFVVPYTVYAFAEGFYPGILEDINFGTLGLEVVLTPVSPVRPTNEWVDFYCDVNTLMGVPLPIGSVVDAFDPDGDHVGTWFVTEEGKYGLMPVYRDDAFTVEDDGADPGDTITLYINGIPAEATGERVWTQNGDRFRVCLNFDGSVDKVICLKNGWSLISRNVDTDIDLISALFGPIMQYVDVILSFEEVGLTYDPDLPEFSTLTSADHLHGYWVRIENFPGECVELNLTGIPVLVNTPIHLEAGWNLVSYLPPVSLPTGSALVSQEGNLRVALGFDGQGLTYEPDLPDFSTLKIMAPCFGYWLKVFDPRALIYPGFNSAPFVDPQEQAQPGLLARLGVAGELAPTTNWVDIYSARLTVDGQPAPTGETVRAISEDGSLVGYGVTSDAGRLMFTPVYAAEEAADGGLKRGDSFTLEIGSQAMNESFVFTGRGDRIEIGALTAKGGPGPILPGSYSLAQNYPNPFNPSTKIAFELPVAGEATLEIYNVLGARIATIAQGNYPAGETVVEWNGRADSGDQVATGIYFYRLKSGSFVQTRKMVLLK